MLKPNSQLVLGSASPYKQALLRQAGYDFTVDPADVAEENYIQSTVAETVRVLSELKVKTLLPKYADSDAVIITADVVGELNGQYLGKPASLDEARIWLQSYSDQVVRIWCGTSVTIAATGEVSTDVRCADVQFKTLTPEQIEQYLEQTKPLDKGGALAIEEAEKRGWVESITGEYAAIIGLSLEFITQQLSGHV